MIEADVAIVYGSVIENARIPAPVSGYYDLVVVPGFVDAHAHPQVVDGGLEPGRVWRDSYEWFEKRRLSVDEVGVRRDLELSEKLARLTFARALLEGVTLIAVTGRLLANVRAWLGMRSKPRAVFLPSVMDKPGWTVGELSLDYEKVSMMVEDGTAKLGVFVHSLGTSSPETVAMAARIASREGRILGLHFSEGVDESRRFEEVMGLPPYPVRIVTVHCIDSDLRHRNIPCVACPATNMALYGRTRRHLEAFSGIGSDWPLLLGSSPRHMPLAIRLYRSSLQRLVSIYTIEGYRAYSMPHDGDIVAYDGGVDDLLEGRALPSLVTVAGKVAVLEKRLAESGLSLPDVEKMIEEAIREAYDKHRLDDSLRPPRPLTLDELLSITLREPSSR